MSLIINDIKDFDLEQTLECGQCFNFHKVGELEYAIITGERLLHVKQKNDSLIFYNLNEDDREFCIHFFDLDRDYGKIKKELIKREKRLKEAVEEKYGVRILNQEFHEMLISFIISQNKHMTHIKQIVSVICQQYGKKAGEINGEMFFTFPTVEALEKITKEDFQLCKTGFRAPYLVCAAQALQKQEFTYEYLKGMEEKDVKELLMSIRGVGEKVASCVMLFGLGFRNAFPVDVWIRRIMEEMYFNQTVSVYEIEKFGREKFGEYCGYAQQYLFYYGREKKIGKITRNREEMRENCKKTLK